MCSGVNVSRSFSALSALLACAVSARARRVRHMSQRRVGRILNGIFGSYVSGRTKDIEARDEKGGELMRVVIDKQVTSSSQGHQVCLLHTIR